jgi:hypothetical protein
VELDSVEELKAVPKLGSMTEVERRLDVKLEVDDTVWTKELTEAVLLV